jgi:precorrin-6x reductase
MAVNPFARQIASQLTQVTQASSTPGLAVRRQAWQQNEANTETLKIVRSDGCQKVIKINPNGSVIAVMNAQPFHGL